jgi:hypothetical protein
MRPGAALLAALLACATSASTGTSTKDRSMPQQMTRIAAGWRTEGELATLAHATAWINSEPLTPAALKGRVVLVQFWTLLVHQLAPKRAVRPGVGWEVQEGRAGGNRGTLARVWVRA